MGILAFEECNSNNYKTFNDLTDGDFVYMIDYKNLSIIKYEIKDVKFKEHDTYQDYNEITFVIIGFDNDYPQKIYRGNCLIKSIYENGEGMFFTTDKRIGSIVLDIMRQRNHYQWSCLTGIFGSPMNRYASKDVKLG